MPTPPSFRSAFTLIELLIVVAIIAILAAIAVPNFLEAQTRSRVARTVTDMRTVANGLEAYAVDNNKYPFAVDRHRFTSAANLSQGGQYFHARIPSKLTTPVAYIATLPHDTFMDGGRGEELLGAGFPDNRDEVGRRFVYNNWDHSLHPIHGWQGGTDVWNGAREWTGAWLIYGFGPDRIWAQGPSATFLPYDSSNGTISNGNIIRSQKNPNGIDPHPRTGTFFWN